MHVRYLLLLVVCAGLARPAAAEGGWKLLGQVDLVGGQYFFQNSAGSANGYADADLQLARSLSSRSGFYLTGRSVYTGFKQVNELAGGGTLFQQSIDNGLGFKWIQRYEGGWSLKPRVGARNQLFRETKDEDWGKGLYDFWRYEAGVALERKTRLGLSIPWTYQFSYDLYYTRYARFKSLATSYGAELSAPDPGSRLLDAVTHQLGYRSDFDFPGFLSASALYTVSLVDFTDQKVVNVKGDYLNSQRSDVYQNLGLGAHKRLEDWDFLGRVRPVVGLDLGAASLVSNQNHFDTDPQRMKFIGAYYDYWELRAGPNASLTFIEPMLALRAGYQFAARFYTGRLAQDAEGAYLGSKLTQNTQSVYLEASYPIWRGLGVKTRGVYSRTSSNTAYEQTYRYNYYDYNYFAGIEWKL